MENDEINDVVFNEVLEKDIQEHIDNVLNK